MKMLWYANIPAGVHVKASAYALHRNQDIFPGPEERDRKGGLG